MPSAIIGHRHGCRMSNDKYFPPFSSNYRLCLPASFRVSLFLPAILVYTPEIDGLVGLVDDGQ